VLELKKAKRPAQRSGAHFAFDRRAFGQFGILYGPAFKPLIE
jgi:hypothetical protein